MWNEPSKERLDKIPRLYETEKISLKEKQIYMKFFLDASDWFVAEFDGQDMFFGFVCLNGDLEIAEWGYFSLTKLKTLNSSGWDIYCVPEQFWIVRPAKEVELICQAQNWHQELYEIKKKGVDLDW